MATAKSGRPVKKAAQNAAKKAPAKAAKAARAARKKAPAAKRAAGQPATAAQQRKQLADALLALRKATVAARHATEQAHKAAAAAGQAAARMAPSGGAKRTARSTAADWQDELVVFEQGTVEASSSQIDDFLVELDGVRVTIELGSEVLALTEAQLTAIKNFLSAFASQQTRSAICKSKGPPG